jgi:hypothetical protein
MSGPCFFLMTGTRAMEQACKDFIRVLKEAGQQGRSLDITEISKKVALPPGTNILDVLDKCRERGWVVGSAWGPSLTDRGEIAAS